MTSQQATYAYLWIAMAYFAILALYGQDKIDRMLDQEANKGSLFAQLVVTHAAARTAICVIALVVSAAFWPAAIGLDLRAWLRKTD